MNAKLFPSRRTFLAGVLGATVLLGTPALTQADQGKWWTPRERDPRSTTFRERPDARSTREWRRGPAMRRGRVVRDVVIIREGRRGPFFRARRVFVRPVYRSRVIFVRPVRYLVAADACIGGVSISARFHPQDHAWYGCNFCDARFGDYDAYAAHVVHCGDAPADYDVSPGSWDDRGGDDEAITDEGDFEE